MEVRWSIEAGADLERIYERILRVNPTAAVEVIQRIYNGCAILRDFPNRGRRGHTEGRRELVFTPLPFIAVYRVKEHAVEISRIYHGAQDWL